MKNHNHLFAIWVARLIVGTVFVLNVTCALAFLSRPHRYAPGFEITGVPARVLVQSVGVLFLMWNATYPPVILRPRRQRTLFAIVLVQQAIGLIGEIWLLMTLPPGHAALERTALRFVAFDGAGLLAMAVAYLIVRRQCP